MKTLFFDCFAGISGDMTLGAFIDAGVDAQYLIQELSKLKLPGYHIRTEETMKRGIRGTQCHVMLDQHEHEHRTFADIQKLINASALNEKVKETALAIFMRVARAEGKVHGLPIEAVHFHEVGAVDSIVDIVGAAVCYHALNPEAVYASGINIGRGFVRCAHGLLPVPAPATAEILSETDFPVFSEGTDGEAATPTGVAILAELAEYAPAMPEMTIDRIGYGFGEREFEILNGLRLFVGETRQPSGKQDTIWVIETNIDDMTGETAGYVMEGLFEKGVRDAFYTPIYMKKNRPAIKLTVICDAQKRKAIEKFILKETSSIGLRRYRAERTVMERRLETVMTELGPVCTKICTYGDIIKRTPEYEDVRRLAKENEMSFLDVMKMIETQING